MSATIDTLEVAKELKAAGFDQSQAEAVARIVRRSQDLDLSRLVAKADIANMATKTDLAEAKVDILRWMVVTQVALGGFIFAAIKFTH